MTEQVPERPSGWLVGRIRGVPVYVAPSWVIIALLITLMFAPTVGYHIPEIEGGKYGVSFTYAVLLYVSVLIHELGHAFTAMRFGIPVTRITLQLLGGVTEMSRESNSPKREFAIAGAGPALSLVLGVAAWGAIQLLGGDPGGLDGATAAGNPDDSVRMRIVLELLDALMYANIAVGLFNLLPGLPLDGGIMLRSALWGASGHANRATISAGHIGRVLAVVVFFIPIGLDVAAGRDPDVISVVWGGLLGGFIWFGATASLRSAQIREKLPSLGARTMARRALPVETGLPLAEALRRAGAFGATGLVVVDATGEPVGLVNEAAVVATPEQRRPWVAVETLARRLEPGLRVSADLTGEALIRYLDATPATEYLVVEADGSVVGVLATADVRRAVEA
ncbi:site-2 protease family protein [Sporichthya polymorpha]|uniref:site-2 protease family protein n=1 Tax=Sporichthya polymorpha TaxID=35751 RepID=UPI000382954F|nr:site-2 protease family protein [Sporichthya polymorpha]